MNRDLMFSSEKDDWETPQDLFDKYDSIYHFDLDACASDRNKKCSAFFSKEDDCRKHEWFGKVWMNPPYGRNIGTFVKKAYEEIFFGGGGCEVVVMLLPARTDTKWFHDYCIKGDITFLRGRLKFVGAKNSAPFPSMIVIFRR